MKLAKSLERLGTESAFTVLAEAKKLEAQGKPMIHLGLGQPDFKTPKHVVEAAKKALDDGHHGYVMSNGIPECRQAVTRWIKKRYNVDINFELFNSFKFLHPIKTIFLYISSCIFFSKCSTPCCPPAAKENKNIFPKLHAFAPAAIAFNT